MLVSHKDFRAKLERTSSSSQSTRPTGRVLEKNYSSFLDFTHNYKQRSGIFVPCFFHDIIKICNSLRSAVTVVVLDWTLRGHWFESLWRYDVVSLSKTLYPLLSTGSTQKMSLHD